MADIKIHLCLAHMSGLEQHYIRSAIESNWVAPLGPNVEKFEKELETFVGYDKHVTAVSSGTAALHLALILSGVGRGDEVICQSFTFIASANPILYQGATPVFVDSETDTWNMSPMLLKKAIEERLRITGKLPKAIVVVHLYGMPARMDEIMDIADYYAIPVIEDAAEAMGSTYQSRPCGAFGKYGIFSFNGNKMITTSGGGALICPSEEMSRKALFYATQAREPFPYYQHECVGYNYRMSNICAGIGCGQMSILHEHIAHHRYLSACYQALLRDVPGISVHTNPDADISSNYWLSTILIDPVITGTNYEQIRKHLAEKGIESRPLWKPLHLQPLFREASRYVNGVSEKFFAEGLCLPSGPYVQEKDVLWITNEIKKCIRK